MNMAEQEREAPKLKMEHGFMKSIIKNQVERDDYDKEQKMLKVQNAISRGSSPKERTRRTPTRPAMAVYVPPHLRTQDNEDLQTRVSPEKSESMEERPLSAQGTQRQIKQSPVKQPELLLLVEFKNRKGDICNLYIYKGDDIKRRVRDFACENELNSKLRDALFYKIQEELDREC